MNDQIGLVYLAELANENNTEIRNITNQKIADILVVEFDTILHSFDVLNRNKRIYTGDNVMKCITEDEKIATQLRDNAWFGEQDHPMQKFKDSPLTPERIQSIDLDNRSHKIMNPRLNGNLLCAHIQTAADAKGPGFAREILAGLKPNFSCRSIAALNNVGGKPMVTVKKLITYDWVLYPSHKEAHISSAPAVKELALTESAGNTTGFVCPDVMIPLTEIIKDIQESDRNINMVMESFGLKESDFIGTTPSRRHAIFKDSANRIFVDVDARSKAKLDDFFESF